MGKMAINSIIQPILNERPSLYADRLGMEYSLSVSVDHKKANGQFFTPTGIAAFMASLAIPTSGKLRILDPGCGTAVLSIALIESLIEKENSIESIELVVYETDLQLIPYTEASLSYLKQWLEMKGVDFDFKIETDDFILSNISKFAAPSLFNNGFERFYDIIISNPPYFKLAKEDKRVKMSRGIICGQTNIYSLFMALAAKMLYPHGQLIFIVPRSFTSGSYFKDFREFFFKLVRPDRIHLFDSRKDAFSRDNVLQETMILKCNIRDNNEVRDVVISSSHGLQDIEHPSIKIYQENRIIDFASDEKILHLPVNDMEEHIVDLFKSWNGSLNKYNIQISTGPVVAFRSRDFIKEQYENSTVYIAPLFWLHNVLKMVLEWPIVKPDKGQYIQILPESKSMLIPNKNYIFLRRFSAKDDKSRLIAAPYFSNFMDAQYIGVENKVNYIYRPNGYLDRNEVVGLCALLNSGLFDNYFRIFNGNVNVSATELREMSLPPLVTIKGIGNRIILSNDYSTENVNYIINEIFSLEEIFNELYE